MRTWLRMSEHHVSSQVPSTSKLFGAQLTFNRLLIGRALASGEIIFWKMLPSDVLHQTLIGCESLLTVIADIGFKIVFSNLMLY